jgi:hypothetical protein
VTCLDNYRRGAFGVYQIYPVTKQDAIFRYVFRGILTCRQKFFSVHPRLVFASMFITKTFFLQISLLDTTVHFILFMDVLREHVNMLHINKQRT